MDHSVFFDHFYSARNYEQSYDRSLIFSRKRSSNTPHEVKVKLWRELLNNFVRCDFCICAKVIPLDRLLNKLLEILNKLKGVISYWHGWRDSDMFKESIKQMPKLFRKMTNVSVEVTVVHGEQNQF